MARPVWEGHLRLSLVTCPVALHKATREDAGVHFHLLHPKTHRRVKQAWRDPELGPDAPDVPRGELLHGYELDAGHYVIVDDADLKSVRLESTKTIQIEQFVEASNIDRLYWDQAYFMVPSGKPDLQEPFAVIREAMASMNRVALGRVVMTGRERTVAIEVRRQGLLLTTLRAANEVRSDAEAFAAVPEIEPDAEMIDIARAIMKRQDGPFDPARFHDRYADALRELIASKADDAIPAQTEAPQPENNVVDLMDALRRSLNGPAPKRKTQSARRKPDAAETPAPKRRPAKRA